MSWLPNVFLLPVHRVLGQYRFLPSPWHESGQCELRPKRQLVLKDPHAVTPSSQCLSWMSTCFKQLVSDRNQSASVLSEEWLQSYCTASHSLHFCLVRQRLYVHISRRTQVSTVNRPNASGQACPAATVSCVTSKSWQASKWASPPNSKHRAKEITWWNTNSWHVEL